MSHRGERLTAVSGLNCLGDQGRELERASGEYHAVTISRYYAIAKPRVTVRSFPALKILKRYNRTATRFR
jgi:hypothetical protein